jgi:hypothetical protein
MWQIYYFHIIIVIIFVETPVPNCRFEHFALISNEVGTWYLPN